VKRRRLIVLQVTVQIKAPPEQVWPYLVDWERLPKWMVEARSVRVTSAQREGVGVRAEAVIKMGGIKTTDPVEVCEWDPPEHLGIEHLGWVKGRGDMECRPKNGGTQVIWDEVLISPFGWLGQVGLRMFKPLMRATFQRDLGLLKALIEGPPSTDAAAVG